jgi:hypothetical protein
MKAVLLFAMISAMALPSIADPFGSMEKFSPHFSTNTPILWNATNQLPGDFWVYRRILPHVFSAMVISNAMVLASLEKNGFPKPSTNDFYVHEDKGPNYPGAIPCYFGISPADANLYFEAPHPDMNSTDIPSDKILIKRARACASLLGVDLTQTVPEKPSFIFNSDKEGNRLTNQICARRVFLSRQLDGVAFYDHHDNGWSEGLSFALGSGGKLRSFYLDWPELQRTDRRQTASVQQIIALIRAHRIIVLPNVDEETYFQRVKALAKAKTFSITNITPYYLDGELGDTNQNYAPPKYATPIAELDAVAGFGNSNAAVRMFSFILSSDATRALTK